MWVRITFCEVHLLELGYPALELESFIDDLMEGSTLQWRAGLGCSRYKGGTMWVEFVKCWYVVMEGSAVIECESPCMGGSTMVFPVLCDSTFAGGYHLLCGRWFYG